MAMAEYIYEIESHEANESEIFVGWIRNHSQKLIRCKDCKHRDWDVIDIPYGLTKHIEWCSIRFNENGENIEVSPNGFCSNAESKVSSNFE